jgi:hypothetical protein
MENQRSHRRKALITKIICKKKTNYETNALPARSRAIQYMSGCQWHRSRNRKMQNTTQNEIRT